MPELGEVAHAAALLGRFIQNRTLKQVSIQQDPIVFQKEPASNFIKALTDSYVKNVGTHGKYFWFRYCKEQKDSVAKKRKTTSSTATVSPGKDGVVLMHFGMTGWIKVKGVRTHFIVMENGGDKKAQEMFSKSVKTESEDVKADPLGEIETGVEEEVWPPKFEKMMLITDEGDEICFIDARRLARIRLYPDLLDENDTEDTLIESISYLKALGPDFSKDDKHRWDFDQFKQKISTRKVPVKSLLLDQTFFSGVGNWMADEILYHARIHPQTYSNVLSEEEMKALYDSLITVCETTAKCGGNILKLPEDWLMLYRWGKRKKSEKSYTKAGLEISHVTVGGRTSSFVPELQKKKSGK